MNRTETANLIAYLNRAGLVGALEGQAAVWADALFDIRAQDAQDAARWMARTRTSTQRWATPGDIRELVTTIRDDRVMRGQVHVGSTPDGIEGEAYSTYQGTVRQLLGDGLDPATVRAQATKAALEQNRQVEA